jgi:hypothetical protein
LGARLRIVTSSACSFCGKDQTQVKKLIAGSGGVYICEICVALCVEVIGEDGIEIPVISVVTDDEWDIGSGWQASTGHLVPETDIPKD